MPGTDIEDRYLETTNELHTMNSIRQTPTKMNPQTRLFKYLTSSIQKLSNCLQLYMLRCFDCSLPANASVGGCHSAWTRAYGAAIAPGGQGDEPPATAAEFVREAQRLHDALEPYQAFMHSVPEAW